MMIHERIWTVDTHCDTPMLMERGSFDVGRRHPSGERGSGKVDFPRMADGGLDAQFFAVFVGQGKRTPEGHSRAKSYADTLINQVKAACMRYPELAELASSPEDALRLHEAGKRAIFLGMENGYPLGKDLNLVDYFYKRGIRYITLSHNGNNEICDSSTDNAGPEWNGLSPFGVKVVRRMNELGMIIDVSHISDQAFYDVLKHSQAPVMASHSCCRAFCDHPRNLSDEMLIALKENGGVIQICFVSSFIKTPPPNPRLENALKKLEEKYGNYYEIDDPELKENYRNEYYAARRKYPVQRASVEDLVDHIDHVVDLIGIDHVGIGTDFDGGGGVEGCDDVSELPNITLELVKRGYSEEAIEKIWGGNFMRVFRQVIDKSENRKS